MNQAEIDEYWRKQSRLTPIPEKHDVWSHGFTCRVVMSIGQDMDVTYQQTGEQGIQWCSWMDWVKWVKNANKDARFVGKVTT